MSTTVMAFEFWGWENRMIRDVCPDGYSEETAEDYHHFHCPISVSIPWNPRYQTEEEHVASVDRTIESYRVHGWEPVFVNRNRYGGFDGVHQSTEIYYGEQPRHIVKKDPIDEIEMAEQNVEYARQELKEAQATLRAKKKQAKRLAELDASVPS